MPPLDDNFYNNCYSMLYNMYEYFRDGRRNIYYQEAIYDVILIDRKMKISEFPSLRGDPIKASIFSSVPFRIVYIHEICLIDKAK